MAWKNLSRNRGRTIISISAIFFAVVLSVLTSSLRAGIFDQLVDNLTQSYSGKFQIHSPGYWNEPSLEKTFLRDSATEANLRRLGKIRQVIPRLESFVLIASDKCTKGGQLVGIDPVVEDSMTNMCSRVLSGQCMHARSKGLLLAAGLLARLGATVGDTLVLLGQGFQGGLAAGKYSVMGSIHFGSPELNDRLAFMPLNGMQDFLLADNRLTSYVLDPQEDESIEAQSTFLKNILGPGYEVLSWIDMMPDVQQHIQTDTRNMRIVQWVLYLLVSFGIFGTLLMMMSERIYEFGMMMAIGMHRSKLILVLIWESFFVLGLGVCSGLLVSAPLIFILNRYPLRLHGSIARAYERFGFEAVFPTAVHVNIFLEQAVVILTIGTILSAYLAIRAFQIDPIKAMR